MTTTRRNDDSYHHEIGMEMTWNLHPDWHQAVTADTLRDKFNGTSPEPPAAPERPTCPYTLECRRAAYRAAGFSARDAHRSAMSDIRTWYRDSEERYQHQIRAQTARDPYEQPEASIFRAVNARLQREWLTHYDAPTVGAFRTFRDDSAMEVNTPVLTTRAQLAFCHSHAEACATDLGLSVRSADTTSGGGHLHLNIPGERCPPPAYLHWLCYDTAARPYIVWALLDPEDDNIRPQRPPHTDWSIDAACTGDCPSWGFINVNNQSCYTLELRCFEMPFNAAEQRAHAEFADTWLHWTRSQYDKDRQPSDRQCIWNNGRIRHWTEDRALTAWDAFIRRTLRLDTDTVATLNAIAARNITQRVAWGTLS